MSKLLDLKGSPELHNLGLFRHVVRDQIITSLLDPTREDFVGKVAALAIMLSVVEKVLVI